jgi:hypothetical protein
MKLELVKTTLQLSIIYCTLQVYPQCSLILQCSKYADVILVSSTAKMAKHQNMGVAMRLVKSVLSTPENRFAFAGTEQSVKLARWR